jgi:flagellar M-ring protein FliF
MQVAIEEAERRVALEQAAKEQAAAEAALIAAPSAMETQFAEIEARKQDVVGLIERQPDEVAQLLRGWLADRRG